MTKKIKEKSQILTLVKQDRWALYYASKELRNNREVVLTAVKKDGIALRYASEELQGDREIVKEAVKQNSEALYYVNKELLIYLVTNVPKPHREAVLEAVRPD